MKELGYSKKQLHQNKTRIHQGNHQILQLHVWCLDFQYSQLGSKRLK